MQNKEGHRFPRLLEHSTTSRKCKKITLKENYNYREFYKITVHDYKRNPLGMARNDF